MLSIFEKLIAFFEEEDWDFEIVEEMTVLSMGFAGEHGEWLCYAQARETDELFIFYSVLPMNVPESQCPRMAEFLTRANYGLAIGNFEMDYNDGEIRYKTSIDVEGTELNTALIRQLVYANLVTTGRYFPGLMRLLESEDSPLTILQSIEAAENNKDSA